MPHANLAADSLEIIRDAAEVRPLTLVGTVPGVAPLLAAAKNGPGAGRLRYDPTAGAVQYKAPDSSTWGPIQKTEADADYLLLDGDDRDAWLRVSVYRDHLPAGPAEARVLLADRWGNGVSLADVTAEEAAAGDVSTWTLTLTHQGTHTIENLVVWLDAAHAGLELSSDGVAYSSPTTEGTALALADLSPGDSLTLYLRRTIAAAAAADPDVLDLLHFRFDAL